MEAQENPEQQQDVSQPQRRQPTGVTIREPNHNTRPASTLIQHERGKQKLREYVISILESSDENGIDFSLLNKLPIPYHLFYRDDKFKFMTSNFTVDFFEANSECSSSSLNNVATNNYRSGISLRIPFSLSYNHAKLCLDLSAHLLVF